MGGIRLDGAQSWPLVLRPDTREIYREDNDKQFHYTLQEILDGEVVLPR